MSAFDDISALLGDRIKGLDVFSCGVVGNDGLCATPDEKITQGIAVISRVCSEEAGRRKRLMRGMAWVTSPRCPGVIRSATGRPQPSTTACIFVDRPPRERPMAWACAPLFPPPQIGEPWPSYYRSCGYPDQVFAPQHQTSDAKARGQTSDEIGCRWSSAARSTPDSPAIGSLSAAHE